MASKPQRTSSRPCGRSPKGSCGPTATLHPTRRGSSARCSRPGTTACHGTAWCARTAASRWATSSGTCSQRRASRCATDAWTSHGRASPLPGETGARPTRHEDLIPQNAPATGGACESEESRHALLRICAAGAWLITSATERVRCPTMSAMRCAWWAESVATEFPRWSAIRLSGHPAVDQQTRARMP